MSDATIIPFPTTGQPVETAPDLREYLAGFIARFPFEPLAGCDFERGFLAGLLTAYEAAGFDRGDARYLAGNRLLQRMSA
jgi:hypothetical protein